MRYFIICLLFLLVGCSSVKKGDICHSVYVWTKDDRPSTVNKIIEVSKSFRKIPGVEKVHVGRVIKSDRAVVDSSFNVGIIMYFRDKKALQNYIDHPDHVKAVKEILRPLAKKIKVYDVRIDG